MTTPTLVKDALPGVETARILIVEDDETLLLTLRHKLSREGYDTVAASRGDDALQAIRERMPDLILLDIMLPGLNGLQLCRLVRRTSDVPILLLTALGAEGDRVAGLDAGADDYVIKPFGMKELLARVRALLRRHRTAVAEEAQPEPVYQFGELEVDVARREVRRNGEPVHMKPKEFDLLRYLCEHAGQVLSREQIVAAVWGADYAGGIRTVDVHMRWLRQKIEADPAHPDRIKTVRGAGYLFER